MGGRLLLQMLTFNHLKIIQSIASCCVWSTREITGLKSHLWEPWICRLAILNSNVHRVQLLGRQVNE